MKKKIAKLIQWLKDSNDTPQKKALGFGVGVFLGVLPATGPLASIFVASFLRLNRGAALLGSLLTNTWLGVAIFVVSAKVGSFVMGIDWLDAVYHWTIFLQNFHLKNLFKVGFLELILPVILGYFLVSFAIGILAYLAALVFFLRRSRK